MHKTMSNLQDIVPLLSKEASFIEEKDVSLSDKKMKEIVAEEIVVDKVSDKEKSSSSKKSEA